MDAQRLTQRSQEALHDAQTKALRSGHTEVDGDHMLLALLDQPEGLVPRLVAQAGGDPDAIQDGALIQIDVAGGQLVVTHENPTGAEGASLAEGAR